MKQETNNFFNEKKKMKIWNFNEKKMKIWNIKRSNKNVVPHSQINLNQEQINQVKKGETEKWNHKLKKSDRR